MNSWNPPIGGSPRRVFGLRPELFGLLLLAIVLAKLSGIRSWPHVYAGQPLVIGRLAYYFDFGVTCLCFLSAAICADQFRAIWRRIWPFVPFLAFALASALLTSKQPFGTFLAISGYFDTVIALPLALALAGQQAVHRLMALLAAVGVAINLSAFGAPSTSTMLAPLAGYFRGFLQHRNELAQFAAICMFITLTATDLVPKPLRWFTCLGALVLVARAGSVQGFLLLPAGILVLIFFRNRHWLRHPMVLVTALFFILLVSAVLISAGGINAFLAQLGRDTSFSGRDKIWELTLYLLRRMPLMGYGVGNFGTGSLSEALLQSFGLGTHFGTTHNSYLEAFLTYGWFGGSLFIAGVLYGVLRYLKALNASSAEPLGLASMLLVMCIVGGFTESSKLFLPTLGWFTFLWSICIADEALQSAGTRPQPAGLMRSHISSP